MKARNCTQIWIFTIAYCAELRELRGQQKHEEFSKLHESAQGPCTKTLHAHHSVWNDREEGKVPQVMRDERKDFPQQV